MNPTRYSSAKLLVALALLFVTAPFVEYLPHGGLVEAMLMTVVMLSSVLAVGGRRKSLVVALALLTPVSKVARMLVVMEAITGVLYIAALISRLVSMYSNTQPPARGGPRIHNREPNEPKAHKRA